MRRARQRGWFLVAGVVLLLALAGVHVVGGLLGEEREAGRVDPSLTGGAGEAGGIEPGDDAETPGSGEREAGGEGSEGADVDPDVVPTSVVYDLVDKLKAAGTSPVTGTDLIIEYEGEARDMIVMRGRFENTDATEVRFEKRGGRWVPAEGE